MMRPVSAVLLCTFVLNGCFSYAAVPPAEVPPQTAEVRVNLSRPMDFPISDVTVRDVVQVSGEVIAVDSAWLRLSAYGLRSQTGYGVQATGETVQIPRASVVGVQRRKMDAVRSSLVAGAVLGVGLLVAGLTGVLEGGRGGGGPAPPL